jgi:predicted LPLAT superfamily acyltransferase
MRRSSREAAWTNAAERGSDLSLRFIVWSIRRLGQAPVQYLLAPIALYFCAFAPAARRASRAYMEQLARFQGKPDRRVGLRDFYRHVYKFADVLCDRFALWAGHYDKFQVDLHGREHMAPLVAGGRGAFLVGAHLGSFDILRVVAREANIPVNVIMYTGNAERVNAAFAALDPESNVRVIDVDPTSTRAAFEIRDCAARGEFVAILADRAPLGGRKSRIAYANFLGRRVAFPEGPYLIAAVLRLPVIMTVALKKGPNAYDVFLETLATGEPIASRDRDRVIQECIEKFARHLEDFCQRDPLQWFNYYEFWASGDAAPPSESPESVGVGSSA